MTKSFSRAATALLLLTAVTLPAEAQYRAERPFRGLFRGGLGTADQRLDVNGSIGIGYDTNLIADARGNNGSDSSDANTQFRGGLGQASAALQYALNKERLQFGATAGTSTRYYPSLVTNFVRRDNVSLDGSALLMRGLTVSGYATYLPYSLVTVFPMTAEVPAGETVAPDWDFASSLEQYVAFGGGVSYSYDFSRRTTFTADYTHRTRTSSSSVGHFASNGGGAILRHGLTENLDLRMGYHYTEARYSTVTHERHVIDAGFSYDKNLSISRRTSLAFDTGTTATTRPGIEGSDGIFYRLTGSARLRHEFGRTWTAGVAYNRGLHFYDEWPEPLSSDSVTAHLEGLINRHVEFQASARASLGRSGFEEDVDNDFDAYNARVSLGYGLSRYISMGLVYAYYRHQFSDSAQLAPGFVNYLNRHSVRAVLQVWAPLYQSRPRSGNATR